MTQPIQVVLTETQGGSPQTFTLPIHFSYKLPKSSTRITIHETCGGAVIQQASVCYTVEGAIIPFVMNGSCPEEYKLFETIFRNCYTTEEGLQGRMTYDWEGYWNENYIVIPYELDNPEAKGRTFTFSGSFLVLCEVQEPDPKSNMLS